MGAAARRVRAAGSCRRFVRRALGALAFACANAAHAQFAGALDLASENRYRGSATDDDGPVLRASVMGDSAFGAYAGLSGLWRTRDAGLASADALVGWSGRWNDVAALRSLDPAWGWDVGVHRTHYGEGSRYDFSEAMLGVLGPGWSARLWWAPHYFGGPYSTLYAELTGSHDITDHWRAFAHVGYLRYGEQDGWRPGSRTDALAGIAWSWDAWNVRLSREGLIAGTPFGGLDDDKRRAAWVLGASVAF